MATGEDLGGDLRGMHRGSLCAMPEESARHALLFQVVFKVPGMPSPSRESAKNNQLGNLVGQGKERAGGVGQGKVKAVRCEGGRENGKEPKRVIKQ